MNEEQIISGCRERNREAQKAFYERFSTRVYRLALRLMRNQQDAFDLTQDTFVRALQRIDSFDGRAGIGTWLYRIATNEAMQLFRHRRVETRHAQRVYERRDPSSAGQIPFDRVDLDDALLQLSDAHRSILILRYYQGLSYEEIAAVQDCSPGTVASRLSRARYELRALLEQSHATPTEEQ